MLKLWPVDSLVKVFPDDTPGAEAPVEVLAARGATESAQVAFQVDSDAPVLEVALDPPRSADGKACLEETSWRRVEYVPVRTPAFSVAPSVRLRSGPSFFPDPLLDEEAAAAIHGAADWAGGLTGNVPGGMTIPLWLTLQVPEDAAPGKYAGRVTVKTEAGEASLPLKVEVSPARVPSERSLKLTHWFSQKAIAEAGHVPLWSEEHWRLLSVWGRNLAEHRSNVILTPLRELLCLTRDQQGRLQVDFTRFDRWVETFIQAGAIGMIEGGHLAARLSGWEGGFALSGFSVAPPSGDVEDLKGRPVEEPATRDFLSEFLPALVAHLNERGWLDRYLQHQADEPVTANAESYLTLAKLVQEFAPELRRVDATMGNEALVGAVDVWCPQSQELEDELAFYQKRQQAGEEVWHYTCLAPSGAYPNRFLNMPLLGTRVLHWFNYTAGATGYLHWGFNQWAAWNSRNGPFNDTEAHSLQGKHHLPAGDTHLVYPGPGGRPLDSIRHETLLEGVQDYELLRVLDAEKPEEARRLAAEVLPTLKGYVKDPAKFRTIRAELLSQVAEVQ
jgi:hypothetical protein